MACTSLETLIRELGGGGSSHDYCYELTMIRLPLDENSNMAGLLEALSSSSSSSSSCSSNIEEVNVDIYDSFRYRPHAATEILDLFATLSSRLTHLTRLWIDSGNSSDNEACPFYTLPIEALALLLQQAPQLKRLGVFYLELAAAAADDDDDEKREEGVQESFQQLETAVQNHPSLQAFGIVGCRLASTTTTTTTTSEETTPFLLSNLMGQSLASLPTLEWVEVTGQECNALGALTPESLGSLCENSTSLTKLTLDHFELQDSHVMAMASALEHSSTIQEITWTVAELGLPGCSALGKMLQINSSLENVTLQLNDIIFTKNMETNNGNDDEDDNENDDPTVLIARGLEQNQSIEYFSICGYATISQSSQEAFATLLRKNTTLVHCSVNLEHSTTSLPEDLQILSEMYLKLNECGRKELFHGGRGGYDDDPLLNNNNNATAPPQQWIDTLWKMRRNLNALYYLLSMNPTLCSLQLAGHINCNQCEMFDTLIKYGDHEQKIRL